MAKQVIYRRGTTAQHNDFIGANGEITVDTVKHVVIVHDGITAGGVPMANAVAITSGLAILTANSATQANLLATLTANAAVQSNLLASLSANAASQQSSINAIVLSANTTLLLSSIAGVQSNVTAANANVALLFGNATVQSEAIVLANANIIALQSGLTAANAAIATVIVGTAFANINQLTANMLAVNTAISVQGSTFATNATVQALSNNITAANVQIAQLQANIAAANLAIANIALSPALISSIASMVSNSYATSYDFVANIALLNSNAATQSTVLDTLTANAATQSTTLTTLLGNAVSQQTTLIDLLANAAAQAQQIANSAGTFGNANVSSYLSAFDGNILPAANVTYSLGNQQFQWSELWVSNNTIYIGNTPIRVANGQLLVNGAPVSGGTYSDANVTAFLATGVGFDNGYQREIEGYYANLNLGGTAALNSFGVTSKSYLGHNGFVGNSGISSVKVDNYNIQIATYNGDYIWTFDNTGNLTFPTGGNLIFNSSAASVIDGVTSITANGNVTAAQFNFANGINILTTVIGTQGNAGPPGPSGAGSGDVNSNGGAYSDNAVIRFDGTSGNVIQNSLVTISDTGAIVAPQASSIIPFYYDAVVDFPSSATYHGAVAHAHSTGKLYYAHAGWKELANMTDIFGNANVATYLSNYDGSINFTASPAVITGLGNISSANFTFGNGVNILSTVGAGSYGNANVASYLLQFDGDIEFTSSTALIGNVDVITVLDHIRSPAYQFSNGVNILSDLYANAAVHSANIATLFSNAATQATSISTINNTLTGSNLGIGASAGATGQGESAVALGSGAGTLNQGIFSVAIGFSAGTDSQGNRAVAVGANAGRINQGEYAVAIGRSAGFTNQGNNSIIINATSGTLNQTTANTFTVAPVRNDVANVAEVLFYNITSKEVTYGNVISVTGNITGGNVAGTTLSGNLSGRVLTAIQAGITTLGTLTNVNTSGNVNVTNTVNSTTMVATGNITGNIITAVLSIQTTGNITAGNVSATQYNFANGVNILSTVTGTQGNVGPAGASGSIDFVISAVDSSNYTFAGPGIVAGNTLDPVLYLYRGFTYTFNNTTGGSHPFAIQFNNGAAYTGGGVSGSTTGTQTFVVPMNLAAGATLRYVCTIHSGSMLNTINIV